MSGGSTCQHFPFTRRHVLRAAALAVAGWPFASLSSCAQGRSFVEPDRVPYPGSDEGLLDDIERAACDFFWTEASPSTGQVKDRALLNGNDSHTISSIAATGFGLSALCIAEERGYR